MGTPPTNGSPVTNYDIIKCNKTPTAWKWTFFGINQRGFTCEGDLGEVQDVVTAVTGDNRNTMIDPTAFSRITTHASKPGTTHHDVGSDRCETGLLHQVNGKDPYCKCGMGKEPQITVEGAAACKGCHANDYELVDVHQEHFQLLGKEDFCELIKDFSCQTGDLSSYTGNGRSRS